MWIRILGGIVCDVAETDPATLFSPAVAAEFIEAPDDAPEGLCPGYGFDGTTWVAPLVADVPAVPAGPPPISPISRRQFYQQLALAGLITQDEALATPGGAIPAVMAAVVATLPSDQRFAAKMLLAGAQTFDRNNAFVAVFAAAQTPPMTDTQVDDLWRSAASL